ncbi:MAG: hypothetical protein AAGA48_38650, partial [Myxococcota bacterium]
MFEPSVWQRLRRGGGPAMGIFAVMVAAIGLCIGYPCVWLGLVHGIWTDRCPTGDLRLDVEARADGLLRGLEDGRLTVRPRAR